MMFLLASSVVQLSAEDVYDWHAMDVRGDEIAVLVLCPGMNSDGAHFLSEEAWVAFAEDHQLGMIAVNFSSDPEQMYGSEQAGYYWPEQGSGDALLDAITLTYGQELPIVIYGFSGGAQFTSRFVEWVPDRIVTWAAYSAQFWDDPLAAESTPPGIVACGELDGARWFPSFSYFYKGRVLGKPWTWVSILETGHHRKGSFEVFVRAYFSSILVSESSATKALVDVDTEQMEEAEDSSLQPGLLSWLPDASLLPQWQKLHHQ